MTTTITTDMGLSAELSEGGFRLGLKTRDGFPVSLWLTRVDVRRMQEMVEREGEVQAIRAEDVPV